MWQMVGVKKGHEIVVPPVYVQPSIKISPFCLGLEPPPRAVILRDTLTCDVGHIVAFAPEHRLYTVFFVQKVRVVWIRHRVHPLQRRSYLLGWLVSHPRGYDRYAQIWWRWLPNWPSHIPQQ